MAFRLWRIGRIGEKLRTRGELLLTLIRSREWELLAEKVLQAGERLKIRAGRKRKGGGRKRPSAQDRLAEASLSAFLRSESRLDFSNAEEPQVSLVILCYNQAPLTYACLLSLKATLDVPSELVLIDNSSSDETARLLDRVDGATIIRNTENQGFVGGCNQGAFAAKGKLLLFLNNDTELAPGAVSSAVSLLEQDDSHGAVGGRLIDLNGRLQEAGAIVWSDGTTAAYGAGADPFFGEFSFVREVDYCSGAFLLTPRKLFLELGGFEACYAPAYYEDADYCMKLRSRGLKTLYNPQSVIFHHCFASSPSKRHAVQLMNRNRRFFCERHADALGKKAARGSSTFLARSAEPPSPRVLIIDDYLPDPLRGAGFPRAAALVESLLRFGAFVTVVGLEDDPHAEIQRSGGGERRPGPAQSSCEYLGWKGREQSIAEFLEERRAGYTHLVISRPHNFRRLEPQLRSWSGSRPEIIYDAEAIYADREEGRYRLRRGEIPSWLQARRARELALASGCDRLLAVSERDRQIFAEHGAKNATVLGLSTPSPAVGKRRSGPKFSERSTILFCGAMIDRASPNGEGVLWFLNQVLPYLETKLPPEAKIVLAGALSLEEVRHFPCDRLICTGPAQDLRPLYDEARLFIAPVRYGAGLPQKVVDAAIHGVPVLTTTFIADQLGWKNGSELLACDGSDARRFAEALAGLYTSEALWLSLRNAAQERVEAEFSPARFHAAVRSVFFPDSATTIEVDRIDVSREADELPHIGKQKQELPAAKFNREER